MSSRGQGIVTRTGMHSLNTCAAMAIVALSACIGGCAISGANELQAKYDAAVKQASECATENKRLQEQVSQQDKQILSLLALGDKRLDKIFHVKSLEIGSNTAAVNAAGKEGAADDAVKVYMLPMDQDGSILKAAGDVKIQLYDLAATPGDNLVGEADWNVDQIGKFWASGFWTYHYSFVCPFKTQPRHSEITVRVEFVDYLTGKHFSSQKVVNVKLSPAPTTSAASEPSK